MKLTSLLFVLFAGFISACGTRDYEPDKKSDTSTSTRTPRPAPASSAFTNGPATGSTSTPSETAPTVAVDVDLPPGTQLYASEDVLSGKVKSTQLVDLNGKPVLLSPEEKTNIDNQKKISSHYGFWNFVPGIAIGLLGGIAYSRFHFKGSVDTPRKTVRKHSLRAGLIGACVGAVATFSYNHLVEPRYSYPTIQVKPLIPYNAAALKDPADR